MMSPCREGKQEAASKQFEALARRVQVSMTDPKPQPKPKASRVNCSANSANSEIIDVDTEEYDRYREKSPVKPNRRAHLPDTAAELKESIELQQNLLFASVSVDVHNYSCAKDQRAV